MIFYVHIFTITRSECWINCPAQVIFMCHRQIFTHQGFKILTKLPQNFISSSLLNLIASALSQKITPCNRNFFFLKLAITETQQWPWDIKSVHSQTDNETHKKECWMHAYLECFLRIKNFSEYFRNGRKDVRAKHTHHRFFHGFRLPWNV